VLLQQRPAPPRRLPEAMNAKMPAYLVTGPRDRGVPHRLGLVSNVRHSAILGCLRSPRGQRATAVTRKGVSYHDASSGRGGRAAGWGLGYQVVLSHFET
jgi:hypothetical protein